jgi:hypothetical protein
MTTFLLLLLALATVAALASTVRALRHDTPRSVPRSHTDWAGSGTPSHPYAA